MVKVAGIWELSFNTPLVEFDQWNFPLRDFGVDEWIMTPVSGIKTKNRLKEYDNLMDVIEDNRELEVVYIDEKGETDLEDFVHPENVIYICGKAGFSPMQSFGKGRSIRITTPNNKGGLWPHQAIAMVLYDRMKKWQS